MACLVQAYGKRQLCRRWRPCKVPPSAGRGGHTQQQGFRGQQLQYIGQLQQLQQRAAEEQGGIAALSLSRPY